MFPVTAGGRRIFVSMNRQELPYASNDRPCVTILLPRFFDPDGHILNTILKLHTDCRLVVRYLSTVSLLIAICIFTLGHRLRS